MADSYALSVVINGDNTNTKQTTIDVSNNKPSAS